MSSCPDDEKRLHVFVLAHVLTHPICLVAEVCLFCFTLKHLLILREKNRVTRRSMTFALGYFGASIANQIGGMTSWVLTPALNLSRRTGAGFCQLQSAVCWVSPAFTYLFLVLFWVERLRQTFKHSVFEVSDKNIALIQVFWSTFIGIELVLGTWVGVETRCSAPSKVADFNAYSMKSPHYCVSTKRGQFIRVLITALGAIMIVMIQVTLGYMYVSRLKAVFVDSGKPKPEADSSRVDTGRVAQTVLKSDKIQRELTLISVNSVSVTSEMSRMASVSTTEVSTTASTFAATPVGSSNPVESKALAKRKPKRRPKLRTTMRKAELDYFRKSAIIALTSCVTTFVAAIVIVSTGVYFLFFWDLLLNALLITSSFNFGAGIYDRLFCCCQRVCVATVDRATSMRSAVKNSPAKRPPDF